MNSRTTLFLVLLLVLLFGLGFFVIRSQRTTVAPAPRTSQIQASPTPVIISTPIPVPITTVRGMITSVTATSLTVTSPAATKNIPISQTVDVQRVTSGTLEGGNAKTVQAATSDLKNGQEVFVIIDKDTSAVRSIFILK